MYAKTHIVEITTDADGNGVGYVPVTEGRILQIRYVDDDYDNDATVTVTLETSGVEVWTRANLGTAGSLTALPRQAVESILAAALKYSADGVDAEFPVCEPIYVAGERVKLVVAGGGDTKTGTFYVTIG